MPYIFDELDPPVIVPSTWEEHVAYPVADWKYEVANDDTRLGYREWVEAQISWKQFEETQP